MYILEQLAKEGEIEGKHICDIGCGPGELSAELSVKGAKVTGVDLSEKMLALARTKSSFVEWIHDDAMQLKSISDGSMEYLLSNLMLMDVPDFMAVFHAAYRILVPGGTMIWTIMHPCFQSPFSYPLKEGGRKVTHYAPLYWKSHGVETIRSIVGSYHRPISDYIIGFQSAGFEIVRLDEPLPEDAEPSVPMWFCAVGRKRAR